MKKEMIISYNKLWKLMIDKKMNKTQLREKAHISTNAIAKMSKNSSVSMETLAKICYALECEIGDVVDLVLVDKNDKGVVENE